MNSELIQKAKEAKSAEELMELAKENGREFTLEQAQEYYDRLHSDGELADDELDNVSGGGECLYADPHSCPRCHSTTYHVDQFSEVDQYGRNVTTMKFLCAECRFMWTSHEYDF